jgi:hypothetical protein
MEIKLNNQTVRSSAARVKSKKQSFSDSAPEIPTATRLIPALLCRGDHESFYHLPTCGICGKPIVDFDQANVVVVGSALTDDPQESLGTVDGAELFRLPGKAVVVHFGCDQGWTPWVRATSVFCKDQRGPIEKLGWRVGS